MHDIEYAWRVWQSPDGRTSRLYYGPARYFPPPLARIIASGGPVSPAVTAARAAFEPEADFLEVRNQITPTDMRRIQSGLDTLARLNYVYNGNGEWKPPIGPKPWLIDRLDAGEFDPFAEYIPGGAIRRFLALSRSVAQRLRDYPPEGLVSGSPLYIAVKNLKAPGWSYQATGLDTNDLKALLEAAE